MITCDVIGDLLPLYADDLLSQSSRELVDAHIAQCPACRDMLDSMLHPLDPEPSEADFMDALRRQKRKQHCRIILVCVLTVLACVLGWWIYMETHFYGETPHIVTTDEAKILEELPQLALTESEIALAEALLREPLLQEAMATGEIVEIPTEAVAHLLADVTPENPTLISVAVLFGRSITLDFWENHQRTSLSYLDPDQNGTADLIRKTIGIVESDGDVRVVYNLDYIPVLERYEYEKQQLRHIWFSFLDEFFR